MGATQSLVGIFAIDVSYGDRDVRSDSFFFHDFQHRQDDILVRAGCKHYFRLLGTIRHKKVAGEDKANPREALLFGAFAEILLVTSFTGLRLIFIMMTDLHLNGYPYDPYDTCVVCKTAAAGHAWDVTATTEMWKHLRELHLPGVLAASIVHLWLPVFAFSASALKSLNKRLQTNLGQKHPVLVLGVFAVSVASFAVSVAGTLAEAIRVLTASGM